MQTADEKWMIEVTLVEQMDKACGRPAHLLFLLHSTSWTHSRNIVGKLGRGGQMPEGQLLPTFFRESIFSSVARPREFLQDGCKQRTKKSVDSLSAFSKMMQQQRQGRRI